MPEASSPSTTHLFSVDVEEHFQVSAFDSVVSRESWASQPSRVVRNTTILLDLLDRHRASGTFFVVGWVAERQPALVKEIAARGHELASHSWWHRRVFTLTPEVFRDDVRRSRAILEDLTGRPVIGFRAPTFSIVPGTEWAFDVLLEEGYQYDSSLFPIRRPSYGYPSAPRVIHQIRRPGGSLTEFPMATWVIGGLRLPAAGGGYLRQLPLGVVRGAFRQAAVDGTPAMFYIHPWEVDPDQPRIPVGPLARVRHYRGLERTLPRMETLLREFRFSSVRDWVAARGGLDISAMAEGART